MRSVISAVGRFARAALATLRRLGPRNDTATSLPAPHEADPPTPAPVPSFKTPIEIYDPHNPFPELGHQAVNLVGGRYHSFNDVQAMLDEFCALLAELGLPANSSRIGAYQRYLQKLAQAAREERHLTEREEIEHFNTLVEIFQLPMIGDAVRASPDRSMWKPHLKKLIAGSHPPHRCQGQSRVEFPVRSLSRCRNPASRLHGDA